MKRSVRSGVIVTFLAMIWLGFPLGTASAVTVQVKILVDEEEATVPQMWQSRLANRLKRASEIIEQYVPIRFEATSFGTWKSDNRLTDLGKTLREFEQEVSPVPAQLAIGFSSQYRFQKGRNSLGGTRGPLRRHILLREGSPSIYEMERIEVLVHELGHFLGAAHSNERDSVMRPVLGDGRSRARAFRIRFDEENASVIRLVASEFQPLRIPHFHQLSVKTRRQLRVHYKRLAQQKPPDPAARLFIALVDHTLAPKKNPSRRAIPAPPKPRLKLPRFRPPSLRDERGP
jgi:hypothetical protein